MGESVNVDNKEVGLDCDWSRRSIVTAILLALTARPARLLATDQESDMTAITSQTVVRVSILRCDPARFAEFKRMMSDSETLLAPGIKAMRGCIAYVAGADENTSSLSNVSIWSNLQDAKQMEHFQPMLDLGKRFLDAGATFERPIMNYATLWHLGKEP
jgi:hypothetical protein